MGFANTRSADGNQPTMKWPVKPSEKLGPGGTTETRGRLLRLQNRLQAPDVPGAAAIGAEVNELAGVVPAGAVIPGTVGGQLRLGRAIGRHQPDIEIAPAFGIAPLVRGVYDPLAVRRPAALDVLHVLLQGVLGSFTGRRRHGLAGIPGIGALRELGFLRAVHAQHPKLPNAADLVAAGEKDSLVVRGNARRLALAQLRHQV